MPVHARLSVNVYPSLYEMRPSLRSFVMTPPLNAASPSYSLTSQITWLRTRTAKECSARTSSITNENSRIPERYTPEMILGLQHMRASGTVTFHMHRNTLMRFGLKRRDLLLGFEKYFHLDRDEDTGVLQQSRNQVGMPWMMHARGALPFSDPVFLDLRVLSSAEFVQVNNRYYYGNIHWMC